MTSRVSDKKGYATIKWDKVPGADGYAVYYGINSKASHALTRGTSKTYAIKSKLTSGRTYYFRVRAFKYVNGERKYAPFCTAKSLKIK